MAFNPKTVYGICNVLNRYSENIKLDITEPNSRAKALEHLAKKMDLAFRDNKSNWLLFANNPDKILTNLISIETHYRNLVNELYGVDDSVQRQISKNLKGIKFSTLRKDIREKFETIKKPLKEVKEVLLDVNKLVSNLDAIAAVEISVEVWKKYNKPKKIPKNIRKNKILKSFISDVLEVFEINEAVSKSYRNWYLLTQ